MKLTLVIPLILLAFSIKAQSPDWQFAQIANCGGVNAGYKMIIDSQDNVYILGSFRDSNIMIQGTTLINAGNDDVFLTKYTSTGVLLWAKSFGTSSTDFSRVLFLDKNDAVYITGGFDSLTIMIDNIVLTNNTGGYDFFTTKFNPNGQVIWAKSSSNSSLSSGIITIDEDLNSYTFLGTPTTTTIKKYNTSDNLIWSVLLTTSGNISTVNYRDFHVDSTGIYITGGFFGATLTIGGIVVTNNTAQNSNDMFVAKLDTAGNVLWAKNAVISGSDSGKNIEVDQLGNVYVLGQFTGTATFGTHSITSNGINDLFLTKYNPSGDVIWAKNAGSSENDWVNGLALDEKGSAYITGQFYGPSLTFANTTFNNDGFWYSSADVFILKFDSSGNEMWLKNIKALGNDNGNAISVNTQGEVFVTGAISDSIGGITNVGSFQLAGTGLDSFFFGKLASSVGIVEVAQNSTLIVYPNPSAGFVKVNSNQLIKKIKLYTINGILLNNYLVNDKKMELTISTPGIYIVQIESENGTIETKKMVVVE